MRRKLVIGGLTVGTVAKLVQVDMPIKCIFIEEMKSGDFRVTYSTGIVSNVADKVNSIKSIQIIDDEEYDAIPF